MKIDKKNEGNNLTISLEGRLDNNSSPELEKELSNLAGIENLILDFKDLAYVSSAGLRVLLSTQKVMSKQGKMVIRNANENVKDIFEVTGFSDIFTIE